MALPANSEFPIGAFTARVVTDAPFEYGIGQLGPSRRVTWQVAGASGPALVDALVGVGTYTIPPFTFPVPHSYPGNPALTCFQAGLHELAGVKRPDAQGMRATFAHVVADYAIQPYDITGSDNAVFTDGVEVPWSSLATRGGFEEYEATNLVAGDSDEEVRRFKVKVPVVTYDFRRSMIPNLLDYDAILSGLAGKVNDAVFFNKPIGTVFLESWDFEDDWDAAGKRVRTFAMTLRWRPVDWNYTLLDGKARTWGLVHEEGDDAITPIEYGDFSLLRDYGITA